MEQKTDSLPMKTIVVSGACSNIGKTTLAHEIVTLIPGAVHIKIGHNPRKKSKKDIFYHASASLKDIIADHANVPYLVIESNRIINQIAPDCLIYLTGESPKPSAQLALDRADIIRGMRVNRETIKRLADILTLPGQIIRKIAWLAGARPLSATAVILAGGASQRMGRDKTQLKINGESIIQNLYSKLKPRFDEIIIALGADQKCPIKEAKTVFDMKKNYGPLMGIYSALQQSLSPINFVIAADIPIINLPLLYKLLAYTEEYDIIAPSFSAGQCEPLYAVYKYQVRDKIAALIETNIKRVATLFKECKTLILPVAESSWYVNLNTPMDYRNFLKNEVNTQ